jgi:hypothetical protein
VGNVGSILWETVDTFCLYLSIFAWNAQNVWFCLFVGFCYASGIKDGVLVLGQLAHAYVYLPFTTI